MAPWKAELDAIVGARHGGQVGTVLKRLQDLDQRHPQVAEIHHQIAWTLDIQGRAPEAIPHYEQALALGLPPNEHSGALIGLGSSLRLAGQAARSVEVLEQGRTLFPDNREFAAFLALALHDAGRGADAVKVLLEALLDGTEDVGLTAYQRALRHHASRLA
jgi:thioredoxin-like negative regulator of GroEL